MNGNLRLRAVAASASAAIVLAGASLACSPALAATTTIGFDDLSEGTLVTNQYEAQGLAFGTATSFGEVSPGAGDCGPPTVEKGTAAASAYSSPNYATLPACPSAGPPVRGSYGHLVGTPRASLSMRVRELTVGALAVEVLLIGYDASGGQVASGHVDAETEGWQTLTATATGPSKISYFMVRTATGGSSVVAIDDVSYEAEEAAGGGGGGSGGEGGGGSGGEGGGGSGGEGGGGSGGEGGGGGSGGTGGGSGGGGAPSPPVAALSVVSMAPAGGALTLSGAGSTPGSGRIISYDWDFNNDGRVDTSTGANPVAHLILPPSEHTVALTVTNSAGEKSTTHLTLPSLSPALVVNDGGEGPCEPTYDNGSVHIVAECVQKKGGGYVIRSRQLDLNGMILAPQSGGYGVFKIETQKKLGIGTYTWLSGPTVSFELLNTPVGDVTLGGRDLEAEPVELAFTAFHPGTLPPISHQARLRGEGGSRPVLSPRAKVASETGKSLILSFGVGQECGSGKKGATCCPKRSNTSCATLPGGFPLGGQVNVYIDNQGRLLLDVEVALDLSSVEFEATGALEIIADANTGIDLSSLKFTIPQAGLAHVFQVKNASFAYYFPDDPDTSKQDSWQAKGTITFGPLGEPSMSASLSFKKGQFKEASMTFTAPTGTGVPIYPGVLINQLGGTIGVEPLKFGGTLGASIATQLELSLSFLYREATADELGFFGGQGKLSFQGDEIATLGADVYSDGYTDAQLKIDLHFPFSSSKPDIEVGGEIGFWDEPSSGRWEADGNVHLKLWVINAEVAGLINNTDAAGCLSAFGGGVQGSYRFSDGHISGGLFGLKDCSDELKQYKEVPVEKHSGGFVKGEAVTVLPRARAAAASAGTISVPSGQMGEELLISSTEGTPVVTLTAPDGTTYTTPASPGSPTGVTGKFIAAVAPDTNQTLVLLMHPQGGAWGISPAPGAPAISKVQAAADVAPAKIHVSVRHRHNGRFALRYRISRFVKGMKVQFVERGKDSTHVIGTTAAAHGSIAFSPQDAIARTRKIYAYVVGASGLPKRATVVGRFQAPPAQRGGRIRKVRFTRSRETVGVLRWSAAAGAREYRVQVRGSDGRLLTLLAGAKQRSVRISAALPWDSYRATVLALGGPNLLAGPAAHARLTEVRSHRRGQTPLHRRGQTSPRRRGHAPKHGKHRRSKAKKG